MKLDLVFKNSTSSKKFGKKFFQEALLKTVSELNMEGSIEVSVNLVLPSRMKALNKKYRNKDKVTDVLSFPLKEQSLKKYDIIPAGDIFICPSYVAKISKSEGLDLTARMRLLSVHGFLHLMGYDHENSEKEAERMERLEKKILNR